MAELKTKKTQASVTKFLDTVADETKRQDSYALLKMFQQATGAEPKMWGTAIVGFGDYHYVSPATGREGDWFLAGFSPRKQNLTLYAMGGSWTQYPELLAQLGKHSLGKGCLYIKRLDDIDLPTLKKLIGATVKQGKKQAALDAKRAKKK
jgi:hypothetical protein